MVAFDIQSSRPPASEDILLGASGSSRMTGCAGDGR
jgi:hypothetical protein